ncbi:hypothetical protein E4U55_007636 [Claviceps digitariae]|nr:hypothetical protein E4U55_007636 [Claviceps digitariae]
MTSWTVPARTEAVENNRDPTMYWEDLNNAGTDDHTNDFFGQFVDFDANANANAFVGNDFSSVTTTMPGIAESIMLMGEHNPILDGNLSSGVSSGDEFDFPSSSSHIGAASAASHDVDPKDLTLSAEDLLIHSAHHHHYTHSQGQSQHQQPLQHPHPLQNPLQLQHQHQLQHELQHEHHFQPHQSNENQHQTFEYMGRGSMSEADLSRLQGISLHSPQRPPIPASNPSSPTPPNSEVRKPKKFVDALSATLKKATKLRKTKKPAPVIMRPGSPSQEPPQILMIPKQRGRGKVRAVTQSNPALSPPLQVQPQSQPQQEEQPNAQFVHGNYEDPFKDASLVPPQSLNLQYYGQVAPDTPPVGSPGVRSDLGHGQFQVDPAWHQHQQSQHQQQQQQQQQLHWTGAGGEYITSQEGRWWTPNMMSQGSNEYTHHHQPHHHQRSASVHIMGHSQPSGMPYEYDQMPETSTGGLMIHMPQPRGSQSNIVMNDLTTNAQAFLPPPPPIPQTTLPMMPASERSHRPPRAKSSGARHLSCSPVRKPRGPSASPTPGDQSGVPRSRHSSGASISSARSSSGRLPGSMPGTPCSIRKRRSRDVSGSSGGMSSLGGDSGVGFVNFTPNDGGVLMTGVAPSGSSKTKARREKEAQERRRRLSEAAIKAVAAAGGDVDKLLEQGFTF